MIAHLILLSPGRIRARLAQLEQSGLYTSVPSLFQLQLGVVRMWHRVLFRPETIGTCSAFQVRPGWRARLLQWRPLRGPFLLWERAIAPWDMSGLLSSPERVVRHLIGAHHDADQFAYDLQMLDATPEWLDALEQELDALLNGSHPRAEWLRDLCVYERYHESLREGLRLHREGALPASDDPDISFHAYLRWCAAQPETARALWTRWRGQLPEGA